MMFSAFESVVDDIRTNWPSHPSSQSIDHIATDPDLGQAMLSLMTSKGEALEGMGQWDAALKCYEVVCGTRSFEKLDSNKRSKVLSGKSNCLREIGSLSASLAASQQVISEDRRLPGAHKTLALAHKAMGDMEEARSVVNRAIFYEEPWNPVNKAENMKLFDMLSVEIREEEERRKREEAFLEIWGPVLALLGNDSSNVEITWSAVKMKSYDIFGDDEANDELMGETAQRLEAAAVSALSVADQEPTNDVVDTVETEEDKARIPDETEVNATLVQFDHIKLTNEVLKWLDHSDSFFRGLFVDKITRLAAADGPDGRKYMKRLVGCKTRIFETYLEQKSGQRILWTYSGKDLLIWYVAKHKDVSRLIGRIDDAESRSNRKQLSSATTLPDFQQAENTSEGQEIDLGRILLDPLGDTPLKLYDLDREDLSKLGSGTWKPTLHLTDEENLIVKKEGTVLLLGRSGTGEMRLTGLM
jgi:tetratricopeptide (TPR) repeat protein